MKDYKFDSRDDWLFWCSWMIEDIKMGLVSEDDEIIKKVLDRIDKRLNLEEHQALYP